MGYYFFTKKPCGTTSIPVFKNAKRFQSDRGSKQHTVDRIRDQFVVSRISVFFVFKIVKIISLPLPEYPEKEKKKSVYEKQDIIDRLEEILDDLSDEEIEALKLAQFQRAGMRRAAVQDMGNNRFTLEVEAIPYSVRATKMWSY